MGFKIFARCLINESNGNKNEFVWQLSRYPAVPLVQNSSPTWNITKQQIIANTWLMVNSISPILCYQMKSGHLGGSLA